MLLQYLGASLDRTQLMIACLKNDNRLNADKFKNMQCPWQDYSRISNTLNNKIFNTADYGIAADTFTSSTAVNTGASLENGFPIVQNIVGGHVILVTGAVVNCRGEIKRYICNDPMGTLSDTTSNYSNPSAYNWYKINKVDVGANAKYDSTSTKGKHVYYSEGTDGTISRSGKAGTPFRFRGSGVQVTKTDPFSKREIIECITPQE